MTCKSLLRGGAPLTLAALLSACAVGPDYRPPATASLKVPADFIAAQAEAAPAAEADLATWWTSFDDAVLTGLVDRGLAANLDIAQAGARLRQSRANLDSSRGAFFPSLGASGSVSRSVGRDDRATIDLTTGLPISAGGDITSYRAGFDASYEVDLFGGIRRSVEAARATAQGSEATLRNTQITVASEIALNYMNARLAQARLDIARANLAAQDETLDIVGWREQAGLVSGLDLQQARQLRANTAATVPNLETDYNSAVNRLAVLLGEAPGAVTPTLATKQPVPLPPRALGVGLPAEMLRRRPDVAAAERSLAAETARIGVATANLYPALRLTGSFSGSETSVGNLFNSMLGNLASSLTAPIFQGGQLRAQVQAQRAATDAALAAYRGTVLGAIEETENALAALDAAERREREVVISADAAETAVIYARSQYAAGLIDFQSLLESERSLLSSQDSRASARATRATATVQLYKALGGGWQSAPLPETAFSLAKRP